MTFEWSIELQNSSPLSYLPANRLTDIIKPAVTSRLPSFVLFISREETEQNKLA